jgi:hypothetical protein
LSHAPAFRRALSRLVLVSASAALIAAAAAAPVGAAAPKSTGHAASAKIVKVRTGRLSQPARTAAGVAAAGREIAPQRAEIDGKGTEHGGGGDNGGGGGPQTDSQRVTGPGGATGFDALSHRDQRFAGTGIYTNTNFSTEPPDQGLCVGNGYVVEGVNTAIAVWRNGVQVSGPTPLNQLFGAKPAVNRATGVYGDDIGDVKCYYDPELGRFFISSFRIPLDPHTGAYSETESHVMLAVSSSNNPVTATWTIWDLNTTDGNGTLANHPNCPCVADQPLIGADHNGFYISTNEYSLAPFGAFFNGAQIYAFSKSALTTGGGALAGVHIDAIPLAESTAYTIQPATTPAGGSYDSRHGGTEYFLSALDFNATTDHRIAVWALTGTRTLGTTNAVRLQSRVIQSQRYGQPPNAEQRNGPTPLRDALAVDPSIAGQTSNEDLEKLSANDDRMNQVVYANGALWSNVNTVVQQDRGNFVGTAWFVVSPRWSEEGGLGGRIVNQGYVSVQNANVMYGSIAVNARGKAAMGVTLVGKRYYPSTAWVRLSKEDDAGPVHLMGIGAGPEDGFTGYKNPGFGGDGNARWGDYSAAVADEAGNLWLANEYIANERSLLANWGTFITKVAP